MLEFNGKKPIRKNLTIEPITLTEEQNQQLEQIMKSKKGSLVQTVEVKENSG